MNATLAAVIEMSIALCGLTSIGAYLTGRSLRQRPFAFWAFSWVALCARLLFDLLRVSLGDSPLLWLGTDVFTGFFAVVPLFGLLETAGLRARSSRFLWIVPGWTAAWSVFTLAVGSPRLAGDLPLIVPVFLCSPAAASIMLGAKVFSRMRMRWPLAVALLGQALLLPQLPWMAVGSPTAAAGFGALGLITLAIAIGLLTVSFQIVLDQRSASDALSAAAVRTLRDVIEASPLGVITLDLRGAVQTWNKSAERILGWSEEEVKGRPIPFLQEDLAKETEEIIARTIAGQPVTNVEVRRSRRDGSSIWLSLSTKPLYDDAGATSGVLGVMADLTTSRLYQETIADQHRLLDSAMEAILVRGTDEKLIFCNTAAVNLYEYTREELRVLPIRRILEDEEIPRFEEARRILARTGEWEGELRQRTKSGRKIVVHSRWSLVRDDAGFPRARLVINRDITRQKDLESQLRRTQRMESLGTLASGIAHDLNNILSPILMSVDLLKSRYTDANDQKLLEILATSVRRGSSIVRQMLTFARGSEGELVPVPLRHVTREVETILRETFPKSIAVTIDVPRDLPLVIGDATQLHQLLLNLSVNSRDAMPEGGNLLIQARASEIPPDLSRPDGPRPGPCVKISVVDDGTGIPAEIRQKIFEPFFTTKEKGKGTGLGLSTVLSIVRNHAGYLRCESEVGRGAKFEIYLPAAVAQEPTGGDEAAAAIPLGAGETVLVIDDDVSILTITREILENYGYMVFSAGGGPAALELVRDRPPGTVRLVLTDMDMPSMGGAAAVNALRKIDPGIPVILMSGLPPAKESPAVTELGVDGVIGKPFRAEELLGLVREVLDARKAAAL